MKIFVMGNDGKSGQPSSLEKLELSNSKLLWVDLYDPSDEELSTIGRYFNVHPLAIAADVMVVIARKNNWF